MHVEVMPCNMVGVWTCVWMVCDMRTATCEIRYLNGGSSFVQLLLSLDVREESPSQHTSPCRLHNHSSSPHLNNITTQDATMNKCLADDF